MAKKKVIKIRLSINLSADELGLTRLFNELRAIEDTDELLSDAEIIALKRRHLLGILYQYSAVSPVTKPVPSHEHEHEHEPIKPMPMPMPSMSLAPVNIEPPPAEDIPTPPLTEAQVNDLFKDSMGGQGMGLE